ncbi:MULTISPECIES: RnfH family protein [unclassified Legionella]|uniref:RnfH family protein n=1 Tax=unclassified Legionella TaxID=2622702 RepID=UPI001055346C|nr:MULTISPECIES: RnfH family protein [unclassified Legionella]MDI9818735.1 RnfH family protein [Legionella sp. PL877]
MVKVELVYIKEDGSTVHLKLSLKPGSTVAEALKESGLLTAHPEVKTLPVGIFAKQASLDTVLKAGDRIEIYRPLAFDPKEKRRQRAKTNKD